VRPHTTIETAERLVERAEHATAAERDADVARAEHALAVAEQSVEDAEEVLNQMGTPAADMVRSSVEYRRRIVESLKERLNALSTRKPAG
jgi:hypothetical protein